MRPQVIHLLLSELEHEISGKSLKVSFDSFVETFRFHTVECSDVRIQNHVFATQADDERSELFGEECEADRFRNCFFSSSPFGGFFRRRHVERCGS